MKLGRSIENSEMKTSFWQINDCLYTLNAKQYINEVQKVNKTETTKKVPSWVLKTKEKIADLWKIIM